MASIIQLPEPQTDLSFPLMKALAERRSIRKWKPDAVPMQDLANLLWAACGETKEKSGKTKSKRSAPSACNAQEIRVYVLMENGVFRYDEESHSLVEIHSEDIREQIGTQKMMKSAPLGLVYVADLTRMTGPFMRGEEAKKFSAWVDTEYISQNVYLYCAAANLSTVALALIDRKTLRKKMGLKEREKIVLTQVVGCRQET